MQLELIFQPRSVHPYQLIGDNPDDFHAKQPGKAKKPSAVKLGEIPFPNHYSAASGNPYASIREEKVTPSGITKRSKRDFEEQAKKILLQYSPSIGARRTLTTDFKNLIQSGLQQSPERRMVILNQLSRYDLNQRGIELALANRVVTHRMLKEISKIFEGE